MALQYTTDAGVLKIPGAYVTSKIQATAGGLGLTGVIVLVGEADAGLPYSSETDLVESASFGPDQFADVQAKFASGQLVDGFNACISAMSDPEIQGSPARIVCVKTNASTASSGTLPNLASGTWATITARKPGSDSNLISRTVTATTAEVIPTTGSFTLLPAIAATDIDFRVNGGAAVTYTIGALDLPSVTVAGINALSGVAATGGADRGIIGSATGTLAVAIVSGNAVTFTRSVAWTVTPSVGDTIFVSAGSAVVGGASQNAGSYVVTAATSTTISATKLLDATGTANQLTSPVGVSATSIASTTADIRAFSPAVISLEAGTAVDGLGKSLEISELTSASGRLSYLCYQLNTTPVTWVSKSGTPTNLVSSAEFKANINIARQKDSLNEDISAGGRVLLALGYAGTSGSAVIASGVMTISVVGGSGSSPAAITLKDYATIADLAAYLNTLTGFSAAAGSSTVGQQASTTLDTGTYTIGSTFGAKNGRIKQDAALIAAAFNSSPNVKLTGALPTSGSPAVAAAAFLTGGSRGATADADVAGALAAIQGVDCNFVVPLFSNDAATDIADSLTASTSTYTIDGINASTRSHVLAMSTLKTYKPRQAFLSYRSTYAAAKAAANNTASFRCSMTFEDVRTVSAAGSIVQFRPWMGACKAAGAQAAAFRKSIFNKTVNINGALQAAGDFNPRSPSQLEEGLDSGLLILRPQDGGGWSFVSDQTTYAKDDNFFFNSIQAVYVGDVIGRTIKQRMEKAIVGQSVADMGRSQALATLRVILDDLRDLKLIAPSDGAPLGYINENVVIKAPSAIVSVGIFEATCLYFVPITVNISAVTQTG